MLCVLFLSEQEKQGLGMFVNNPFRKYNKPKECFDGHKGKVYHKACVDRASLIYTRVKDREKQIDVQINNVATENLNKNKNILPHNVYAVLFCARQ